jgi:hypothetical protein
MSIDMITNWRSLTAGINSFNSQPTFALHNIFKATENHASDIIDWEVWTRTAKLASFVSDTESPVPSSKGTGVTYSVKIPKTANLKLFTAKELADYKRLQDAGYIQNASQRLQAQAQFVTDELKYEQLAVMRTREYMAMKLLVDGTLTAGNNTITMNYVSNKQTFTLTSGNKWSDTGVNPLDTIDTYKSTIMKRSNAVPNICLLGSNASSYFKKNDTILKQLDANNYRTGALDLTQGITEGSVIFLGTIRGISFFEYVGTYDDGGTSTDIMNANKICLLATDGSFRMHHAPIIKTDGIFQDDIYVRVTEDPYGNWKSWTIEQKSLPIVHNKDLVISATVV